jgi:hypothetical protein
MVPHDRLAEDGLPNSRRVPHPFQTVTKLHLEQGFVKGHGFSRATMQWMKKGGLQPLLLWLASNERDLRV